MLTEKWKDILKKVVLPLLIGLLSFTIIGNTLSSVEHHKGNIAYLESKKDNVLKLTAASTAASAAITIAPGDVGTPIAESLADISNKFIIVIGAIFLEKYLLTLTGFVAFKVIIPLACIIYAANYYKQYTSLYALVKKMVLVSAVLYLTVPTSILVSQKIEDTYHESIEQTVKEADKAIKNTEKAQKDKNLWDKFIDTVGSAVGGVVDQFTDLLNSLIESFAVMIITSCVIPILVMMFLIWVIKLISNINFDTTKISNFDVTHRMNNAIKRHKTRKLKTPSIND